MSITASRAHAGPGQLVPLSDGLTYYELVRSGGGCLDGPTVVLIHGFSVPSFVWDSTFTALVAAGLSVLRYDLFGRGHSDRPHARYDLDLFDRQLVELLGALKLRTPVDLIGLSMGGALAVGFADRHPALVRRLVLIDPAGYHVRRSWLGLLRRLPALRAILRRPGRSAGAEHTHDLPESLPALARRYLAQMRRPGFFRALLSTWRYGPLESMQPAYARVGRQRRRMHVIWGTKDHTVPFESSGRVLADLPNAGFAPIAGCGHAPHLECPDMVNGMLVDFLIGT